MLKDTLNDQGDSPTHLCMEFELVKQEFEKEANGANDKLSAIRLTSTIFL